MRNNGGLYTGIIILLITLTGCGGEPESENTGASTYQTVTVKQNQLQPFVTFEEDSIAQPQDIEVLPNGNVAILDYKLKSVMIYDDNGERVVFFGKEGKGPGEFVRPTALEQTTDYLYINDQGQNFWQKYTHDGSFVESVQNVGGSFMADDVDIIADGEYLVPTDGRGEALIQYKNINTDSSFYFGKPMRDSTTVVDFQKNIQQAQNGEIPNIFRNMVFLARSDDAYYAFLKSYGRLMKYDRSGVLQWDKKIDLPLIGKIHQEYVGANQNRQGGGLRMLAYARDMDVVGGTIYLLMNAPGNENQQLLVINDQGDLQKVYEVTYPDGELSQLAIPQTGSSAGQIYLVDGSLGRVYVMSLEN